jgi:hypothetical protein
LRPFIKNLGKAVYVNSLPPDLLRGDTSIDRVKRLFAQHVELVEIENHSYCNRTCWFCPNAFLDRRSVNHLMPEAIFEGIVSDLASVGYRKSLVWSRYHEALAHESIYDRVARARALLPKAFLVITSNGDYLNRRSLKALEEAKVDRLLLDLYLPEGKETDPAELAAALEKFSERTGLTVVEVAPREYVVIGSSIAITMGAPNFTEQNMSTRAGLMQIQKAHSYHRTSVCLAPIRHIVIDYNGKGMLCCQTRSDAPQHQGSIIGDLTQPGYSIFCFYRDLGFARAGLVSPGLKGGVCESCDVSTPGPNLLARRPIIANTMRALGIDRAVSKALSPRRRRYE